MPADPPTRPPAETVLAEGLLAQIPGLAPAQAEAVAAALAYDLRATGWLPQARTEA